MKAVSDTRDDLGARYARALDRQMELPYSPKPDLRLLDLRPEVLVARRLEQKDAERKRNDEGRDVDDEREDHALRDPHANVQRVLGADAPPRR
jgi:hypothetical protein